MANANIAPHFGSILAYSSQASYYPVTNLIDGYTATNYQSKIEYPTNQWVLIDLGAARTIRGFKLWSMTAGSGRQSVRNFRIGISNSVSGSFTTVVNNIVPFPKTFGGVLHPTYNESVIAEQSARYVKLYLDAAWGVSVGFNYEDEAVGSAELEIIGDEVQADVDTIQSTAEVYQASGNLETRYADSQVYIRTYTDTISIPANAYVDPNLKFIISDAFVTYQIASNAYIEGHDFKHIYSNSYVYQSGSFIAAHTLLVGEGTAGTPSVRNILVHSDYFSNSSEVVVPDMITSSVFDMQEITPPLGYQDHDWAYDWVVRTYNGAQYKAVVRSADTLQQLNILPFNEIKQGQIIPRADLNRYHQLRFHVWASGSGDFELHQATIKGYIENPANPAYRALYNKPFTTVSKVDLINTRLYEPIDFQLWTGDIMIGDVNSDGVIDWNDLVYLNSYIFTSGPAPVIWVSGDTNYDGRINVADVSVLGTYLYSGIPIEDKL